VAGAGGGAAKRHLRLPGITERARIFETPLLSR
jgi:hypothetical protein